MFKAILVPALVHRTLRIAAVLLVVVQECMLKSPSVRHTSDLSELTATWCRCVLCPAEARDSELIPAQRETDTYISLSFRSSSHFKLS